ncbi:hypothetical protein [Chondromyces apiculatus]|uniref:Uncharacterized protein n=1 Tax=Chondromyces apiculatus DSM 436 TaxID=1192034 RepID=A0A017T782_9BACT|nr:hypothetical protein [Chondromyces apiculatus]EYF05103.1 Hypothetical protein CAP_3693 [Chondromyces apiculatus DSM 436]
MSDDASTWKVLPHDPIEKLAENLWRVVGTLPHFSLRRVMTVARMGDGRLVIHSAIALDPEAMREIEAWGEPAFLLIPHTRHRMDAPRYKQRYPGLRVLAPKAVFHAAAKVVPVEGTYEDFPADEAIRLEMLRGVDQAEGAMIVRSADGVTVVLNEVVFDLTPPQSLAARVVMHVARLGPGPRVTPVVKVELVRDRGALREELLRYAALPELVRLIVSHDKLSTGSAAAAALRQAASTL